jgi:hypothetical protein
MRLTELIEHCHLDLDQLNRDVINNTIIANYSDLDLCELAQTWLCGIGSRHQVPGSIVWTITSIADQARLDQALTRRQKIYLIQTILEQWHQIQLESRVEMGL